MRSSIPVLLLSLMLMAAASGPPRNDGSEPPMFADPQDLNFLSSTRSSGALLRESAGPDTFAIFGGVYYLFPKFSGKMYNEFLGKLGFWLSFIGVNVIFFPMMVVGVVEGMPRRYWDYSQFPGAEPYQHWMSIDQEEQRFDDCTHTNAQGLGCLRGTGSGCLDPVVGDSLSA